ncbi:hypothetical protein [Colwellia sp. 75C3]|uniref:hypothetical protein n=1 Tax=Colwellia sp. 75C3 TaxID=888425 RepID=UPI001E49C8AC|nr:hypothetical protein [Colwellia sp. 75C3]
MSEQNSSSNHSVLVSQCIESQSRCEVSTELGIFSIKFSQNQLSDKVKTELPFVIELSQLAQITTPNKSNQTTTKSTKQSITNVSAYLEGKDMFMGKVPLFFEQGANEGTYIAQSLLASCSEDQMVWRLWVTIERGEKTKTFFVDFTSQRL